MKFPNIFILSVPFVGAVSTGYNSSSAPTAQTTAGTVIGTHSLKHNQDLFLGIPFAEPPTDHLRFERPRTLAKTWDSPREAKEYGPMCFGNNLGLIGYDNNSTNSESEDCLTINVIRPHTHNHHWLSKKLPVLVWVYGGGFQEGGSSDPRYRFHHLIERSVEMGSPIIGVSFNYRLNSLGFISGQPFAENGSTNLGIHDQRLAFQWIQENIAAFGGDPRRITLQGESAGALSIGLHLLANRGRNDGLFHGAILESGTPFFAHNLPTESNQQEVLEGLLAKTGCSGSGDVISCLRAIPAGDLVKASAGFPWHPVIDGDLFSQLPSESIEKGEFVHIPLLIGTNTNEGTAFLDAFSRHKPVDTIDDMYGALQASVAPFILPNQTIARCHELYSDVMKNVSEADLGTVLANPGPRYGRLHGEASILLGDSMFTAGRRITCQAWARRDIPVYSYRFDTNPAGLAPETFGSAHFQEVPFVFGSVDGEGYDINPFDVEGPVLKQKYLQLSQLMSRMWISFAQTGSPNYHGVPGFDIKWPRYDIHFPTNIIFNATRGTALEADNYRTEAMDFFWETAKIFHR